jgi:hypothetical protein
VSCSEDPWGSVPGALTGPSKDDEIGRTA